MRTTLTAFFSVCLALVASVAWAQQEGDLRLKAGTAAASGRLEIYHNNAWGTVCDDLFGDNEATVACRQLGYPGAKDYRGRISPGSGPIWLDTVDCTGTESKLSDCQHEGFGVHDCSHDEDITVFCDTGERDGDLRLVEGDNALEGRIEVFLDDEWGTVCDDHFDNTDAAVVCRQLGHGGGAVLIGGKGGRGPIHLDNVACTGTENMLIECEYNDRPNCFHFEDMSIACESSVDNPNLHDLELSGIPFSFHTDTTEYELIAPHAVAQTTVTPTLAYDGATVAFDPTTDADTVTDGHQVNLAVGTTTLSLTVTAADGMTTRTYTLTIIRDTDVSLSAFSLGTIALDQTLPAQTVIVGAESATPDLDRDGHQHSRHRHGRCHGYRLVRRWLAARPGP